MKSTLAKLGLALALLSGSGAALAASIGGYTCEEQASWGKCSEGWMHPTCSYACPAAAPAVLNGYFYLDTAGTIGYFQNGQLLNVYYPQRSGGYTNGGLVYPDLGACNSGCNSGGGYTTGGLLYPNLGAGNGRGW